MEKNDLGLKRKEKMLLNIIKKYKVSLISVEVREISQEYNKKEYLNDVAYIHLFDKILQECDEDTNKIIRNEYLGKKRYRWYNEYYSRSTYYRLKNKALDEILTYFFDDMNKK